MEAKHSVAKDGLNPKDFKPMEPEEIPFKIEWEGIKFAGIMNPSNAHPPYGIHIGFLVHISGKDAMNLTIYDGEWIMPGAPQGLANVLGDWIEDYYKNSL